METNAREAHLFVHLFPRHTEIDRFPLTIAVIQDLMRRVIKQKRVIFKSTRAFGATVFQIKALVERMGISKQTAALIRRAIVNVGNKLRRPVLLIDGGSLNKQRVHGTLRRLPEPEHDRPIDEALLVRIGSAESDIVSEQTFSPGELRSGRPPPLPRQKLVFTAIALNAAERKVAGGKQRLIEDVQLKTTADAGEQLLDDLIDKPLFFLLFRHFTQAVERSLFFSADIGFFFGLHLLVPAGAQVVFQFIP